MRRNVRELLVHDIAIDLGTANTLMSMGRNGIVIDEPSLVATADDGQTIAVGKEALRMLGRSPVNIHVTRPLIDGVVANFEATEFMLRYFMERIQKKFPTGIKRPRVVIGLPASVTDVERRAVEEAARNAGAGRVFVVDEPIAAVVGSGVPLLKSKGTVVVDIGGGTTEIAVISYGGIAVTKSLRTAGDELNEVIQQILRDEHAIVVGDVTAEEIKKKLVNLTNGSESKRMLVKGKDVMSGLPRHSAIRSEQLTEPLKKHLRPMIDVVRSTLEETPGELLRDVSDHGVILTGGGGLLRGLDRMLSDELKIPVHVPPNALSAVVEGIAIMQHNPNKYAHIFGATRV